MILKVREMPERLIKLEALSRRIPTSHTKMPIIEQEIMNRRSGYRGEQSLDYHLSFLPENKYIIIHDLRLKNPRGYYFQIDTLILCSNFFIIIDAKNFSGSVTYDGYQFIQTYNQERHLREDPIEQINRQSAQLEELLQNHHLPKIPIHPFVVLTNSSTIIESIEYLGKSPPIIHSIHLISRIKELEKSYRKVIIPKDQLIQIAHHLINKHKPENYHVLTHLKIAPHEIVKGVHCPSCSFLPIKRMHGRWTCPVCQCISKDAHVRALIDYSLLLETTITTKKFCDFLLIRSPDVASRLLRTLNLPHYGKTRGTFYDLMPLQNVRT